MRRGLFMAIGLALVTLSMASCATTSAQATDNEGDGKTVELLFVQTAHRARLANGVLTMEGVAPATLYFSDRPERLTGHLPTATFVEKWGEGDDSFASNPPNAALSIVTGPVPQEIIVVLRNPRVQGDTLTYDVEVLDGNASAEGDASSLFIDTYGHHVARHHARHHHAVHRHVRHHEIRHHAVRHHVR